MSTIVKHCQKLLNNRKKSIAANIHFYILQSKAERQILVTCRSTGSELDCSVLEQTTSTSSSIANHSPLITSTPFCLVLSVFLMSLSKINKVQESAPPLLSGCLVNSQVVLVAEHI